MCSGRLSLPFLLSVLLLVGQGPLSALAKMDQGGAQAHCHTQTDGGHHCGADHAGDTCQGDQSPQHCSQGCDSGLACAGCSATLAAVVVERLLPGTLKAATPDPLLSDGLISRTTSPAERPPRPLLD